MNSSSSVFVSTACMPGVTPLMSRVSEYRQNGMNAIEIGAGVSAAEETPSRLAELSGQFLIHNYFPQPEEPFVLNLASSDRNILDKSLKLVFKAIDWSAHLKAPFYSIHAGFVTDPTGFGTTSFIFPAPSSPSEVRFALERFVCALERALEYAHDKQVQLLVENNVCSADLYGRLLLQTADEFLELFHLISGSNLGILLDTGHLNVTAQTLGFDRLDFVEQVLPFVKAIHLHDNDGTADSHQAVTADSWALKLLRQAEFAGVPIVLEARFQTVSDTCRHLGWLRKELGRE